jgi:hypothetical protein
MATKTKSREVARPVSPKAASAPVVQSKEDLPDFMREYTGPLGTEGIETEDLTIPRLKIAQSISDVVKDGTLEEGAIFLNVTSEPLWAPGDPPLPLIIVSQSKEYILWKDLMDDGGGILARAHKVRTQDGVRYKWDKPNQKFENRIGGKSKVVWETKTFVDENGIGDWGSEIPGDKDSGIAATSHHNYLVMLPNSDGALAAVSMSKSGVKVAKALNTALKSKRVPIFGRLWHVITDDETSNDRTYKNWKFRPAGFVKDKAVFQSARELFEEYRDKDFVVDQTGPAPEDGATSSSTKAPF